MEERRPGFGHRPHTRAVASVQAALFPANERKDEEPDADDDDRPPCRRSDDADAERHQEIAEVERIAREAERSIHEQTIHARVLRPHDPFAQIARAPHPQCEAGDGQRSAGGQEREDAAAAREAPKTKWAGTYVPCTAPEIKPPTMNPRP